MVVFIDEPFDSNHVIYKKYPILEKYVYVNTGKELEEKIIELKTIMDKLCKLSDEQLVKNYANGDSDAFDTLLARYQQKIYSYILFLVHDDEVADDLFQETFMKAIVTIRQGRYVESGRFSAWLTRIAHNLVIDKYRQDRNSNVISNDASDADLFNDASLSDITVEMKMITEQSLTDVGRLLKELPDNQKEVLYMRFYQDLSFKEIADATGVSINTALGRMRYGLINLRKMVSERGIVLEVY